MRANQIKKGHEYAAMLIPKNGDGRAEVMKVKFLYKDGFKNALCFEVDLNQNARKFDKSLEPDVQEVQIHSSRVVCPWDLEDPTLKRALEETHDRIETQVLLKEFEKFASELQQAVLDHEMANANSDLPIEVDVDFVHVHGMALYSSDRMRRYAPSLLKEGETFVQFMRRMRKAGWTPLVRKIQVTRITRDDDLKKYLKQFV